MLFCPGPNGVKQKAVPDVLEVFIMPCTALKFVFVCLTVAAVSACSPEIGSTEWCEDMKTKDKGEWRLAETGDFAKHCVLP